MTPYREQCQRCEELARQNAVLELYAKKERRKFWLDSGKRVGQVCAVIFASAIISGWIRGEAARPNDPPRHELCRESVEIIDHVVSTRVCAVGATLTTEVLPKDDSGSTHVLFRCKCGERADGGT